jgi:hypothetical protein
METFIALYQSVVNRLAKLINHTPDQVELRAEGELLYNYAKARVVQVKAESGLAFISVLVDDLYAGRIEGLRPIPGVEKWRFEEEFDAAVTHYPNIWGEACKAIGLSAS